MLSPLTIGSKTFPTHIIQGPLAGISSAPFRLIATRYGQPAFTYTEMISCKTLIQLSEPAQSPLLKKLSGEGPVCVQLSANCLRELGEGVKIVTDCGANLIDLNCGCPVKKIRKKNAGSAHLSNPSMLYALITSMKKNTHLPISVKIRVDGQSIDRFNDPVLQAVRDASPDFITVHGRNWRDSYNTLCHYDQIQFFVESLAIPVIGNGDVACEHSMKKMIGTGCAGMMVSRAGVGQPWLLKNPASTRHPPPKEVGAIFFEHVHLLAEFLGNETAALNQARTLSKYYARHMHNRDQFCAEVIANNQLSLLNGIIQKYFCNE